MCTILELYPVLELIDSKGNTTTLSEPQEVTPETLFFKLTMEFVLNRTKYMGGHYYYPLKKQALTWEEYYTAEKEAQTRLKSLYTDQITKFNCKGGILRKAHELWPTNLCKESIV